RPSTLNAPGVPRLPQDRRLVLHRRAMRSVRGLGRCVLLGAALTAAGCGALSSTDAKARAKPPASVTPAKPIRLYAAGVVSVGGSPQVLLSNAGSLWIATPSSVVKLNLHNGSTIARLRIPTNGVNAGLAFGAGSIWLAPTGGGRLLRIDPSSNRVVA